MGFRINTNVNSFQAQRNLRKTTESLSHSLNKLSSGSRITKSSDDAAGLAISEKLRAEIRSTKQADRNANDAISLVQTAEGGLQEVSNILIRLRELGMQSATDSVTDTERAFTNLEYQALKQEIDRIAKGTEFSGRKLLNGDDLDYEFQIGINNDPLVDRLRYSGKNVNANLDSLELSDLGVDNKDGAQLSLTTIDSALSKVSGMRATLGAVQNRLNSTSNNLQVIHENLSSANSRIRDTDYADETSTNTKLNVISQAGISVLSQANNLSTMALQLLN